METHGFLPKTETIDRLRDEMDFNRAVQCYRFFYPTVSGYSIFKGNEDVGVIANKTFSTIDTKPRHRILTANSDTPYGPMPLDLSVGPLVIEIPAGPFVAMVMDINQRWVADMGIPGPDQGKGGKYLFLPPGYDGEVPSGYHVAKASSFRILSAIRAIPVNGDVKGALESLRTVKAYPLNKRSDWVEPKWVDGTEISFDTLPFTREKNIGFWEALHEVVESEPAFDEFREFYGELAALGIAKGAAFTPDARMKRILETAARIGCEQMRVEAFDDSRSDRMVWSDRKWEWVSLRFEDGDFNAANYVDLVAREKWFFQAIGASPAMFRRSEGAGSLYWLGARDSDGALLDGGKSYRLDIPQPLPAKLFWSVTVYDSENRSQIDTDQGNAALRSMFELKDLKSALEVELYFGPEAPRGKEKQWIKTIPGRAWFAYFRIYGPEKAAFDGSWRPGDFEMIGGDSSVTSH